MEPNQDYSLMHVVNHLKYCTTHNDPKFYLTLEYKFAKPAEPVEGNKKFKRFLEDSHQQIIILNANREVKRNDYVHLKSMTDSKEFQWFQKNIQTLNKIHKTKSQICQKVDLNAMGQKMSFDSETQKWSYKSKRLLFRPNYETVKNGKLFRISLTSQAKGDKEPRRKIVQILEDAISKVLSEHKIGRQDSICGSNTKLQQKKSETTPKKECQNGQKLGQSLKKSQPALRFKREETIILNNSCSIVMSEVYQSINIKLYKSIQELVATKKNSLNDLIGKLLLSDMVHEIFNELKSDLAYEVQMRFNPEFLKQLYGEDEEHIYHIMQMTADVFVSLSKDPNQFSAEQIVHMLDLISKN